MKLPGRPMRNAALVAAGLALMACGTHPPAAPPGDVPPGDLPVPPADKQGYVGLPKSEALARAASERKRWRVVREEGQSFPVTQDYQPGRLNFIIERGVVVRVTQG